VFSPFVIPALPGRRIDKEVFKSGEAS